MMKGLPEDQAFYVMYIGVFIYKIKDQYSSCICIFYPLQHGQHQYECCCHRYKTAQKRPRNNITLITLSVLPRLTYIHAAARSSLWKLTQ